MSFFIHQNSQTRMIKGALMTNEYLQLWNPNWILIYLFRCTALQCDGFIWVRPAPLRTIISFTYHKTKPLVDWNSWGSQNKNGYPKFLKNGCPPKKMSNRSHSWLLILIWQDFNPDLCLLESICFYEILRGKKLRFIEIQCSSFPLLPRILAGCIEKWLEMSQHCPVCNKSLVWPAFLLWNSRTFRQTSCVFSWNMEQPPESECNKFLWKKCAV